MTMIDRIAWLFVSLWIVIATGVAATRPNIVFLLADDLGFSDLGCYGSEVATPHLDSLAKEGLRFTQFYNTSKCFPSRACLLNGIYAQQSGMHRKHAKMQNAVTLAEVLKSAGYRTLMTGKHHGTENPFERGFDRYFGLRDGACNYFNPGRQRDGEGQPAQKNPQRAWCIDHVTYKPYTPAEKDFYTTDAFTDAALGYLDDYKKETTPFFLYLSYNAPHDPLQAWPEDIAKYRGKYQAGYSKTRAARWAKQRSLGLFTDDVLLSDQEATAWNRLTEAEKDEADLRMAVYAAMIDRLDQNVGRLLTKLETLGKRENTIIFFASDNGGSAETVERGDGPIGSMTRWTSLKRDWANVSNTPFRKYKNDSMEGGITSPLIVSWPGHFKRPSSFVRTPSHLIDIMATLADFGQADYPTSWKGQPVTPLQGVSLRPLLEGRPFTRSAPLFWQWNKGRALRIGRWKLVSHGRPWELYDLEADRTERDDVSHLQPGVTRHLAHLWEAWADEVGLGQR
ncbi:arylsulfatase [bacterium]|nr:arylsulfatase [bacterium]